MRGGRGQWWGWDWCRHRWLGAVFDVVVFDVVGCGGGVCDLPVTPGGL